MNLLEEIKNRSYLKVLIPVLIIVMVLKFFFLPFISGWENLNLMIEKKEIQLDKALRLIAHKDDINRFYSKISSRIDIEELFQLPEVQKLSFYNEVNTLADECEIRIKTLRPGAELEEGLYFEIEGEGSFLSLLKFINQLENAYTQNYIQELVLIPTAGKKISFRFKVKREFL